jgi:hypothetical protein
VTPCHNITDNQLRELSAWAQTGEALPPEPGRWREGPHGWTTRVSVPVDIDKAISGCLAESVDDGWAEPNGSDARLRPALCWSGPRYDAAAVCSGLSALSIPERSSSESV